MGPVHCPSQNRPQPWEKEGVVVVEQEVLLPQALECQASRRKVPVLVLKMKLDSHEKKAEKGCCEIITVLWKNESYATKHRV